jgi:hypothetical protein
VTVSINCSGLYPSWARLLRQIADRRSVPPGLEEIPGPPCSCGLDALTRWIESVGSCLGFEAVYSTPEISKLEQELSSCGAALIQVGPRHGSAERHQWPPGYRGDPGHAGSECGLDGHHDAGDGWIPNHA